MSNPRVVVLAGPNGAGKSTAAPSLLRDGFGVRHFVNADEIARGLSAYDPEGVAFAAGRLLLARLDELASERVNFAFETTLASRTFAPRLRALRRLGYTVHLVFLWLPTPELAVERVRRRVASGGHDIPEIVVRRRYARGIRNFFSIYRPLATTWALYDSSRQVPRPIAFGKGAIQMSILDEPSWRAFEESKK